MPKLNPQSRRATFAGWLAGCAALAGSVAGQAQNLPTGPRLKDIPAPTLIGAHFNQYPGSLNGPANTVADREYNCGQPTWYPGFGGWTGPGQYNFTSLSASVNWFQARGKVVEVHMLTGWNAYMPGWLKQGTWTNQQLDQMLRDMIYAVMDANGNKTKVDVWNVVNEAFAGWGGVDGAYCPDADCLWHQLGWEADASGLTGADRVNPQHPVYIRKAFEYARQKTNADLELREFGIEYGGSRKAKAFYQLAKHLLNSGVPLDAVGFQNHFNAGYLGSAAVLKQEIGKYRDLGLKVNFTEQDISTLAPNQPATPANTALTPAKAQQQRADYYDVVKAGVEAGVGAIYLWGVRDGEDPGWRTDEHPLPFDENYDPKPAYYGIQQALADAQAPAERGLSIRARGECGSETMALSVDGAVVKTWANLSPLYCNYYYPHYLGGRVQVAFTNDQSTSCDRNVQIDYVEAGRTRLQAEAQAVNTGVFDPARGTCGGLQSEWLHCNGYVDFGTPFLPAGAYTLTAKGSGKLLDVDNLSLADGANVQQWTANGGANQRWQLASVGGGYYTLTAQHSGKALDVNGAYTADGTNVQQWTPNNGANQRWKLAAAGGGYYTLAPAHAPTKRLEVDGGGPADGANVQIWADRGDSNAQQWRLDLAGAPVLASLRAGRGTLSVYPNPAAEAVTVAYAAEPLTGVTLTHVSGRVGLNQAGLNDRVLRLPVQHLPAGVYLLEATTAQGRVLREKLVLK